jgi:hypothetical protein
MNPLPIPDEVWSLFVFPRPGVEDRSFKTNMNPGDVVLYPGAETNKVCISYGLAQFSEGPAGPTYVNHLATVDTHGLTPVALAEDQFVLIEGFRTLKLPRKERFHLRADARGPQRGHR